VSAGALAEGRTCPAAGRLRRRLGVAAALTFLPLGAAGVAFVAIRPDHAAPNFPGVSIAKSAAYRDQALLERAWQLPAASQFGRRVAYQTNPTSCGASSLANVERSFGLESTEASILAGTGKCWFGYCLGGLTLDELASVALASTQREVTVKRDISFETFREELQRSNDLERRVVINFHRGSLFGQGMGHFSPIGGFLEKEDLVLVLDVNAKFGPFLVDARRLYDAMNTTDAMAGKRRGLLVLR
jgi:hypothetical protein